MNEPQYQHLIQRLRQWTRRRRLRDGLIWVPRGVLLGLLMAVMIAAVARLRPLLTNSEVAWVSLALILAGLFITLLIVLLQRFPIIKQAVFADQQFNLYERASTALEIYDGRLQTTDILAQKQLEDTVTAVTQVNTARQLPLAIKRQDWLILATAVVLLLAAILLNNPQVPPLLKQRAIKQTIVAQTTALQELSNEIAQNETLTETEQEQLQEPLAEALQSLADEPLSQEEAVAVLSEAEADLRQLADEFNNQSLQESLQTAGQALTQQEAGSELGQALQSGDLAQAGSATAQLADDLPGLSAEQQTELAQQLNETAAALENIDSELAQALNQAAQALTEGDTAAAQQALREAAATLQQRAQETAVAQQAQSAAEQLGESRQEIAQAGQEGQAAAAQQAAESQDAQQGNASNGQQSDQSAAGESGQFQLGSSGQEQDPATGGPAAGDGHSENVFVPDLLDLSGTQGVDIELPAECRANPANCGSLLDETPTEFQEAGSNVPYTQVFGDYRNAANEALDNETIPLGLKGTIRDYFSSLEP